MTGERRGWAWHLSGEMWEGRAEVPEKVRVERLPQQPGWCLEIEGHSHAMAEQSEQREDALGLDSQAVSGTLGVWDAN